MNVNPIINPTASDVIGPAHTFDVCVLGQAGSQALPLNSERIEMARTVYSAFFERWNATHVVNPPSLLIESGVLYLWMQGTRRDVFEQAASLNGEQAAVTQYAGAKRLEALAAATVIPATSQMPRPTTGSPVKGAFGRR